MTSDYYLVFQERSGNHGKTFKETVDITGIVLTKLDGTAKGGIVLAIKENIGIPVKFVGLGERLEDLRVFDIEIFKLPISVFICLLSYFIIKGESK